MELPHLSFIKILLLRIRLNLKALWLVFKRQWISESDLAAGYDAAAPFYDDAWRRHLADSTEQLIHQLPKTLPKGRILDLGCGLGYTTSALAALYPEHLVTGIDLSKGMLTEALKRSPSLQFEHADMLKTLKRLPSRQVACIFSAWAIGYSDPQAIIRESGKALTEGATLAFIVNTIDTLAPIFEIYRACMRQYPGDLKRAIWPKFPKGPQIKKGHAEPSIPIEKDLKRHGFQIEQLKAGTIDLTPPDGIPTLQWLLKTGVLAGFDHALPLTTSNPLSQMFDTQLQQCKKPLRHHYLFCIARRL